MTEGFLSQPLRERLSTKFIGRRLYYFSCISSTQDEACRLAKEGAPEGTVVIAEKQSAGRGRRGRRWASPSGGLWFSVVLYPGSFSGSLMLAGGVAVSSAVREVTSLPALVKWPNDILVRGKKLAGILVEGGCDFSVMGVGVNVNLTREELCGIGNDAVSVKEELGREVCLTSLACEVFSQIERYYLILKEKGPLPVCRAWRSVSAVLGRQVIVSQNGREIAGEAVDIEPDGALVIRLDSGIRKRVISGELR